MTTEKGAQLIDDVRVRMGRLIRVENTQRPKLSNANKSYISVWVEDADGKNRRCLLFTEREIQMGEERAAKNLEDLTQKTLLNKIFR